MYVVVRNNIHSVHTFVLVFVLADVHINVHTFVHKIKERV